MKIRVPLLASGLVVFASQQVVVFALPGSVKKTQSKFDGSTEISTDPGWCGGMTQAKMGLWWNSQLPPDVLVLNVTVVGTEVFSAGESLHFNLDGTFVNFKARDQSVDFGFEPGVYNSVASVPGYSWSSQEYLVPPSFIRDLLAAKQVGVRIDLSNSRIDAALKAGPMSAIAGFRKFMAKFDDTASVSDAGQPSQREPAAAKKAKDDM